MSDNKSKLALDRPLSAGEILDRAFALFASNWVVITVLVLIGLVPRILLSYYQASQWVSSFPWETPDRVSVPLLAQGIYVALQVRGATELGSFSNVSVGITEFFWFLTVGACATVVADVYARRPVGISDAVRQLNGRWMLAAPAAICCSLVMVGGVAAFEALRAGYNMSHPVLPFSGVPFLQVQITNLALSLVFVIVQQAFRLACGAFVAAAVLEAESLGQALSLGLQAICGRQRMLGLILFSVGFTVLFWFTGALSIIGSLALYLTRLPFLFALCDAITNILPWALFALVTILYFLDSRLRQGVNVPDDFAARQDAEAIVEA